MLTKGEFEELVSSRTGLPRARLDSAVRLDADLGIDSFGLLELATSLAEFGVELNEREWLETETLGELYDQYRERVMVTTAAVPAAAARSEGGRLSTEDQVTPPQLAGQFFRLVPVLPPSVPFLYGLSTNPEVGFRWRYRGAVPSPQQFEQDLWQGVLAQFVVESIQTSQAAGHVVCYSPDRNMGHAYLGAAMTDEYHGSGIAAEPVRLFLDYLFDVWPFHKVYLELPEFNLPQFASATGRGLHVEARMRNHHYYQGRRWDQIILAAYRSGEEPSPSDEFNR
jgi:RimJ/RimL family protein N-acetyltransferase/acyl carrier protein